MSYDLAKLTVTARRHVPTAFGNKDAFYSETIEIPSETQVDRAFVYAFLAQRMDLTYLLDCYYSCPAQDGTLPNVEIWPHVTARIANMTVLYAAFPEVIQGILAFNPEVYQGK